MTEQTQEKKVLIFKLASGEDVISRMVADELCFYLESPYQIVTYPDQGTGQMRAGLMPFMGFAEDDSIVLSRIGTHFAIPTEAMTRTYLSAITGIELPDNTIQLQ